MCHELLSFDRLYSLCNFEQMLFWISALQSVIFFGEFGTTTSSNPFEKKKAPTWQDPSLKEAEESWETLWANRMMNDPNKEQRLESAGEIVGEDEVMNEEGRCCDHAGGGDATGGGGGSSGGNATAGCECRRSCDGTATQRSCRCDGSGWRQEISDTNTHLTEERDLHGAERKADIHAVVRCMKAEMLTKADLQIFCKEGGLGEVRCEGGPAQNL